jgi:hypothetical protein
VVIVAIRKLTKEFYLVPERRGTWEVALASDVQTPHPFHRLIVGERERDDVVSVDRAISSNSALWGEKSLRVSEHESSKSISRFTGRALRRYWGLPERAQECG